MAGLSIRCEMGHATALLRTICRGERRPTWCDVIRSPLHRGSKWAQGDGVSSQLRSLYATTDHTASADRPSHLIKCHHAAQPFLSNKKLNALHGITAEPHRVNPPRK